MAIETRPTCRQCGSAHFRVSGERNPDGSLTDVRRCANCGLRTDAVLAREVKPPDSRPNEPIRVMGPKQTLPQSESATPVKARK
jgi:hypothetical protein